MKRLLSFALCLVVLLGLAPALAAGAVTPTPPSWVPESEYAIFPDSKAYEPENWAKILALRADAEAGNPVPSKEDTDKTLYDALTALQKQTDVYVDKNRVQDRGLWFELGLIMIQYESHGFMLKQILQDGTASSYLGSSMRGNASLYPITYLWYVRARILEDIDKSEYVGFAKVVLGISPGLTFDDIMDCEIFNGKDELKAAALKGWFQDETSVFLNIDGKKLSMNMDATTPGGFSPDGQVMALARDFAEGLGAEVTWKEETQEISMLRAGHTVEMKIGSTTATIDGKAVEMGVAPVLVDGKTRVPARFLAEVFGQLVTWEDESQTIYVSENKAAVEPSNLEAWALAMSAVLQSSNRVEPYLFGGIYRIRPYVASMFAEPISSRDYGLRALRSGWGIESREELIETIARMTSDGHNQAFLDSAAQVDSLSTVEYQQLLKAAQGVDAYMWPYTKELSAKWGDRGILAWDLFRMSNLIQWGYIAGYVTYPEALALLEPAAAGVCENFTSWEEAVENYLDGYNWWARNDVLGQDVWQTERGLLYAGLKSEPRTAVLFNDELFTAGVIPVPGLSFQDVVDSVTPQAKPS